MIKKVNLDKAISIKEKHKILWDENTSFDQRHLENNLKKAQLGRFQNNEKQKEKYNLVLKFLKERGGIPMQEEQQILDGLKIILDNGWVITSDELLKYLELLGIKDKSRVCEENLKFLEFIYLVGRLFEVDILKLQEYFEF